MKKPKFFLIPPLILALCLTLCVALAAATDTPEIVASGDCGADGASVTWTLDSEGTLTISGTGNMKNYEILHPPPWNGKQIKSAVIADGVTNIGHYAFYKCDALLSLTIPDSVIGIGGYAFAVCSSLTSVVIPKGVANIENGAFSQCYSLLSFQADSENSAFNSNDGVLFNKDRTALVCYPAGKTDSSYQIPESVTSIEHSAFRGCKGLTDVIIPKSVTRIGNSAFSGCSGLTSVTIPESVTDMGICAFEYCHGLTSVTILGGIIGIAGWAFEYCDGLTSVTIPESVTRIGDDAFSHCHRLKSVYYAGTEEQWNSISIGMNNEAIRLWSDIYYDGNRETPGRITSNVPKIVLTYAPAYLENRSFEGVVHTEDGSAFDTSAYRVTLYANRYYPKTSWANPSVSLQEDGSFSNGGDVAVTFLDLMLIPADFDQKNASYEETRAVAIDYVEVYRTEDGEVTVYPERQVPMSAIPSGLLPVKQNKIAVDVGFYTNGSSPGSALSADLIRQQLDAVSKFSDTVRFYGSAGELAKAYEIAHNMGFAVLGNAWLSKDKAANQTELDALIGHCNNGYCKIAIVGSEVLLRGDLTAGELIEAIEYVRERLTDKTIPVTTADSVDILIAAPSVRNACNLLMPNCYPYWGGSSIEQAAGHFIENMEALNAVCAGKEILVSETGWPTAGQGKDNAKAGETEAAQYYSAIREWSLSSNTQVLFFDATDEPWKTKDEGESGAHWGFMTTDFVLKDCYKNLNPFQEKYAIEYVSGNATSATASLTNNTGAVAEICYAVAAYNTNGRMISCNMVSKSMGVSESVSLAVSYSESDAVTQIKAFVLDANTFAPLQGAWAKNSE